MTSPTSVSFLGYGRFGQALGIRLQEIGTKIRAMDAKAEVPAEIRAASFEELLEGERFVVIATPVAHLAKALQEIRPFLNNRHIVLDVGSVKTGPTAVMQEALGHEIPWVATHPLFGPTSLALGERPIRAVVCPNLQHPDAVARVIELYEALDCEVLEKDAEIHDKEMAESHALAYFVAKGFLDSGVTVNPPHSPPSAKAIGRTVDAVREDAAHLFASLHRENPYAKEARRRLLDSLLALDEALEKPLGEDEEAHAESGALHFAEASAPPPQLLEARDLIDGIDGKLLDLLAQRARVSLRAAQAKAEVGKAVRDPERENRMLSARRVQAEARHLNPDSIDEIFQAIIRFSRGHQTEHSGPPSK